MEHLTYRCETWKLSTRDRQRITFVEMDEERQSFRGAARTELYDSERK